MATSELVSFGRIWRPNTNTCSDKVLYIRPRTNMYMQMRDEFLHLGYMAYRDYDLQRNFAISAPCRIRNVGVKIGQHTLYMDQGESLLYDEEHELLMVINIYQEDFDWLRIDLMNMRPGESLSYGFVL